MERVIKANVFSCLGSQLVPQQDRFDHPSLISQLRHINMEKAKKKKKRIFIQCVYIGKQDRDPAIWRACLSAYCSGVKVNSTIICWACSKGLCAAFIHGSQARNVKRASKQGREVLLCNGLLASVLTMFLVSITEWAAKIA